MGEEDEAREKAAIVIQRYAGVYLERKYVGFLKVKKKEEDAEKAIVALKAKFRVPERPELNQLCFDLETQQNNALFQVLPGLHPRQATALSPELPRPTLLTHSARYLPMCGSVADRVVERDCPSRRRTATIAHVEPEPELGSPSTHGGPPSTNGRGLRYGTTLSVRTLYAMTASPLRCSVCRCPVPRRSRLTSRVFVWGASAEHGPYAGRRHEAHGGRAASGGAHAQLTRQPPHTAFGGGRLRSVRKVSVKACQRSHPQAAPLVVDACVSDATLDTQPALLLRPLPVLRRSVEASNCLSLPSAQRRSLG